MSKKQGMEKGRNGPNFGCKIVGSQVCPPRKNGILLLAAALLLAASLLLLASGCSSGVSQKEAEESAVLFVKEHVRFYVKPAENSTNATAGADAQGSMSAVVTNAQKTGDIWRIDIHVEAQLEGTVKQSDVWAGVDAKNGKVISFNGQPVPQ